MPSLRAVASAACLLALLVDPRAALATTNLSAEQQLARALFRELIEMDTTTATGDTARAAHAMAARLRSVGFAEADVRVFAPAPRKGNLVARLRGTGARRPILLLGHLDVVPASRDDWSTDPFMLVEKDGWFYGRGTSDDKAMASALVTNLIRYKREGYQPERDIIVVLSTDEEISDFNGVGIRWLLKHHRNLLDAELALNEDGDVEYRNGKPISVNVQTSEKAPASFLLEVKGLSGHSAVPTNDSAIYRLAEALTRLSKLKFPVQLTETTRLWLQGAAASEESGVAADMRAVARDRDPAAAARLSAVPFRNAQLRTTCVATVVNAGQAINVIPQTAQARVNCRLLPGDRVEDVTAALVRTIADERVTITNTWRPEGENLASPLDRDLLDTIERVSGEFWPGVPVLPTMVVGMTDGSFLRSAGIPTYGHSGFRSDVDDYRAHGRDERLSVASFYQGTEYLYRLVKVLAGPEERATATR